MADDFSAEQLAESMAGWKPAPDLAEKLAARLKRGGVGVETQKPLAAGLAQCARSTFDYIQFIHEFSTVKELDAKGLAPQMAHWGFLVGDLRSQAKAYGEAFQRYSEAAQPGMTRDHFDTHYYDAILGLDIRGLLKGLLGEVEVLLQAMALASGELKGLDGLGVYEDCVRFQLFLQYLLLRDKFNQEEMWSVLFDLYNLLEGLGKPSVEPSPEDLQDLQGRVRNFKAN
ncbi:MAG TPA: hypothetical protein VFR02_00315 [bacterium]|nr:hypothetical protein [bacterium]